MEGFAFSTEIQVRFAETDAQGIAHHASFVVWFEVARVAYLKAFAGGYSAIRERGLEALTTQVDVRYHRAAYFTLDARIRLRRLEDAAERRLNLRGEGTTTPRTLVLVPATSVEQLGLRLRADNKARRHGMCQRL